MAGASRGGALVRVRDNGGGLRPDHKLGLGLTGMRERILALGGTLTVASGEGGVTVEALVPNDVASRYRSRELFPIDSGPFDSVVTSSKR